MCLGVLYVRLTGQLFLYKYYKRLKRKIKTPQLAFIKTTSKVTYSLYNMHK